jgi:hypothetical protein
MERGVKQGARRLMLATAFLFVTGGFAQDGPRAGGLDPTARPLSQTGADKPDYSGVWVRLNSTRQIAISDKFHPDDPPLTPWAEERYRIVRKGITDPMQQAREDIDPILEPYCMTAGFPRIYLRPGAMEIVQSTKALYMLFDDNSQARRIYMDGRGHPENTPPTFLGHSIGRWEGNTIFIETVGFNDLTWLDGMGHPHSTELRVEERLRMTGPGAMKVEFLFDDPKAFTRPWSGEKLFETRSSWELMDYTICEPTTGEAWWDAILKEGGTREP